MNKYSVINKFNYCLFSILFNILNVILVGMMYTSGCFGVVEVSFKTLVIYIFQETFFNQVDLILLIGAIVVALFEYFYKGKKKRSKTTSYNQKTFRIVFIPIICVFIAAEVHLLTSYVDSGWLIAIVLVGINMLIFNYVYVLRLYKFCDRLFKRSR